MENNQENQNQNLPNSANSSDLVPSLDLTPEVYAERVRIQLLSFSDEAVDALRAGLTSNKIEVRRQTAKDYFAITGIQAQKATMADASINAVKEIAATTIKSTLETLGQMFGNPEPIIVNEDGEKKIVPKKSHHKKIPKKVTDSTILELLDGQ